MTTISNSFEGGTNATAITTGNSGGASGAGFDMVNASGTIAYTSTSPLTDDMSALLTAGATQSPFLRWDSTSWPGASEVWFRGYFEVSDATPTSNFVLVSFKESDGSTTGCDVRLTTAGKIQLRAPSTERYLSTYTVAANTPFRLEVHVVSSASVGRIEARLFYGANLNGTTPDEAFGSSSTNWDTGNGTVAAVNFGCCTTPGQDGYTLKLDGVALADDDWLGPESFTPPPSGANIIVSNSFEGGTDGAALTTGNSGGASGDAFDSVPLNSGTVEYDTAVNRGPGSVTARCIGGAAAGPFLVYNASTFTGADSELWFRWYMRITALPSATTSFATVRESDGSTTGLDLRLTTGGEIQMRAPATTRYTSTLALTVDQWIRCELRVLSNASTGHFQLRLFDGANVEGVTPDETVGDYTANWDTGDGTIGGMALGWVTAPGLTASMYIDDIAVADDAWIGPSGTPTSPSGSGQQYIGIFGGGDAPDIGGGGGGGGGGNGVSSLLVPDVGAWFGATTPAFEQSGTTAQGLDEWLALTNFRPHILPWYKVGAWNGTFTNAELALIGGTGGVPYAIPKFSWKIGAGSGTGTWADVANGVYDTQIDNCAAGIKTYPFKMMLCIFHEPEDNVNTSGNTRPAYRAMWQRVRARFDALGVDNVVWYLQFAGAPNHAVNAAGSGFEDMYPGDDYIDWLGMDPYTHSPTRNTLDELVNQTAGGPSGYGGWYNWAQTNHPSKPIILGEFGAGNVGCQGASTLGVQFTDAQGASVVNDWIAALGVTNTAIKAFCYWNGRAVGKYDYQIQRSCRTTLYGGAVATMANHPYFNQDTSLARF